MASLGADAFEAAIEALCPHCTPRHLLADLKCLSANCVYDCQDRDEEQRRVRALAALCLASKQVGSIATRHLYHRPTTMRWAPLARTLLARPDLARRVRHLCARDWLSVEFAVRDPSFPAEVAAYWASKAPYPVMDWFSREYGRSTAGNARLPEEWEAVNIALDIVASLCPVLEELDAVLGRGEALTLSPPGSLAALRTAAVAHYDTEGGLNMHHLAKLALAAPGLHTLVGWQVQSCLRDEVRFEELTSLRPDASGLEPGCLQAVLRACPRLETFEYRAAAVVGTLQFTPRQAEEALVELAPGLKSLAINLDDMQSGELAMGGDWVFGSLKGLSELRHLEVDTRCIIPHKNPTMTTHRRMPDGRLVPVEVTVPDVSNNALVELLPESIRELKILQWQYGPAIEKLGGALEVLAEAAGIFPKLRTVHVQGKWGGAEGVRRAFEEKGITFVTF